MSKSQSEAELPTLYGVILLTFLFALTLTVGPLVISFVQNFLGLTVETSFIAFTRTIITLGLVTMMFPYMVLLEALYCRWKKRKFRLLDILVLAGMLGAGILVLNAFSFTVQLTLPRLSFTNEPFVGVAGLVLGLTIALPVLTVALVSRIPRVREYLKKMHHAA